MITLYTGTPGSGKSLRAAYRIIWEVQRGKTVIGNMAIDTDKLYSFCKRKKKIGKYIYVPTEKMTVPFLVQYAKQYHKPRKESQTLVIIDEPVMFNPRTYARPDRLQWITFFATHRHLGFDFLLITQNDKLIDKQIRSFIETEFRFRSIRNFKLFGSFLYLITGGLFVAIEYWYGPKLRCGSDFFRLNRKKAAIYDSFQNFNDSAAGSAALRSVLGEQTPLHSV